MIALAGAARMEAAPMEPDPLPAWWQPGAMALLLVDLQQGTLAAARRGGLEVIHTVMANLTSDGRDRSLDYKRCGMGFPPGSRATQVIAELAPRPDELVLPKSSSSPFSSTTLDYVLRNIGIRTLVVIGLLTDQCIDHTVKNAAERHTAALACFQCYASFVNVDTFLELLKPSA